MKKLEMYYQCWLEVTKQQRYRDKWLTNETYFQAIKAKFPMIIAVIVWIHWRDKDTASVVTGDMPLMGTGNAGEVITHHSIAGCIINPNNGALDFTPFQV